MVCSLKRAKYIGSAVKLFAYNQLVELAYKASLYLVFSAYVAMLVGVLPGPANILVTGLGALTTRVVAVTTILLLSLYAVREFKLPVSSGKRRKAPTKARDSKPMLILAVSVGLIATIYIALLKY